MELKDQVIRYFDQNPESGPEDFISLNPDVALSTVKGYWELWKKLAAWRYTQGLEGENLAKKAPITKKRKELIQEQKTPRTGLGLSNPQIQSQSSPKSYQSNDESYSPPIRDIQQVELMNYLLDNQESLVKLIEQAKIRSLKDLSASIFKNLDEDTMSLFDKTCSRIGLTRTQGLNVALRDFIHKNMGD
jgi:hypothetical protein